MSENSLSTAVENQSSCGQRLAEARTRAGMSLEQAAARSHLPIRALQALESGEWDRLGAPVFVRGQVRTYARLLELDPEPLLAHAQLPPAQPVQLISHEHSSAWERFFNQLGSKVVYAVMTLGLAIPVYMVATRSLVPDTVVANLDEVEATSTGAPPVSERREAVAASMAALPRQPAAPVAAPLVFRFEGESWVQFFDRDGELLEQGLIKPGEVREFAAGRLGRAVVGNAAAVHVSRAGQAMDMSPWAKSNVARFAVSSDGSPAVESR
ncbi:helix-turn-helix domain-containing protein [Luteimonas sp. e5]